MHESEQQQNERYFLTTIYSLKEGGIFGWMGMGESCVKRNDKLVCPKKSYDKAKEIVSKNFFIKHFELKTETKIKTNHNL